MAHIHARGRARTVRGGRKTLTPRYSPHSGNSHRSSFAAPKELSKPDVTVKPMTEFEKYAGTPENPRPSKFGGTDLERAADNVAAEALGFEFDYAQYYLPLTITGDWTTIDRVLMRPRTAVYLDGIQHDIREAGQPKDALQQIELESEGWLVVRIKDKDMRRDPVGEVRRVLYAV